IRLSSTTHGPDALSTTFASNVGADVTEVFSGSLLISTAGNTAGPAPPPFDIVIPLQHSFTFDSGPGKHLLLDVILTVCPNLPSLSASMGHANFAVADSVSRVFSLAAGGATADTLGLIPRFTMDAAGPPAPPTTLVAAVLPYSRSVQVNTPATA